MIDSERPHRLTLRAHGRTLSLRLPWDTDMEEWIEAFKTMLLFVGYGYQTIHENLPDYGSEWEYIANREGQDP